MTVFRNEDRWDVSNVLISDDGTRVEAYDKRAPTPEMKWIDYGLGILTAEALDQPGLMSLTSPASTTSARTGRLAAYEATERFYEIGTPEALAETDAFLRSAKCVTVGRGVHQIRCSAMSYAATYLDEVAEIAASISREDMERMAAGIAAVRERGGGCSSSGSGRCWSCLPCGQ